MLFEGLVLLASSRRRPVLDMHDLYRLDRGDSLFHSEVTASYYILWKNVLWFRTQSVTDLFLM